MFDSLDKCMYIFKNDSFASSVKGSCGHGT